jgi:galactokinase
MNVMTYIDRLRSHLCGLAGCSYQDTQIVRAPLRISPLGAHVDHQDGLVTGMTLDRAIFLAFVPREDRRVVIESLNFPGRVDFSLDAIPPKVPQDWGNYARGAAMALTTKYDLSRGISGVVAGSMPIGGLSSSAAVGIAYLLALETANGLDLTPEDNIRLDRFIENVYLGLRNGVLDQSMILLSERNCLTYLDCQSMSVKKVPAARTKDPFEILVVYSGVSQNLTGTDYNNRVVECQMAARKLLALAGEPIPEEPRLRMVAPDIYERYGDRLEAPLGRRARHFFTEIRRVQQGVRAWRAGDIDTVGRLMQASGASSVYNYESGCSHLTTLYEILSECPWVYGARFSGGGFRGSCIGLSHPEYRAHIKTFIEERYPQVHPDIQGQYSVHFCRSDGPARLLNGKHP